MYYREVVDWERGDPPCDLSSIQVIEHKSGGCFLWLHDYGSVAVLDRAIRGYHVE